LAPDQSALLAFAQDDGILGERLTPRSGRCAPSGAGDSPGYRALCAQRQVLTLARPRCFYSLIFKRWRTQNSSMKVQRLALLLLLLAVGLLSTSRGTVLSDWQTGSQITVPDDWKTHTATGEDGPGFSASSYDPKDMTFVGFNVDDQLTQPPLTEKSAFVQSFIQGIKSQSSVVTGQSSRTANGTNFLVVSSAIKGLNHTRYMDSWFTLVKGHICEIDLQKNNVTPDKTDALNKIIQSFTKTDHVLAQNPIPSKQAQLDQMVKDHPFSFYGVVVDENNKPVAGATVKISVGGELGSTQGETEHDLQSGPDGLFSLEEIRGMDATVTVGKDGYYSLPDKHNGPWFWMAQGFKPGTMPSKDQPAIFPLKKKGPTEPLIVLKTNGSVHVPTDGTSVDYNLEKRRVFKGQPGTFNVQLWVDAHDSKSNQPYHWKYRITVPGGGIQPATNEYEFSAPSSGYQEFFENEITPGAPGWNDSREQKFFVRLADGRYARIRFEVRALGDFFIENGYLNPSGSQNLEFDPAKRIKAGP
jgi:hypothetical protein